MKALKLDETVHLKSCLQNKFASFGENSALNLIGDFILLEANIFDSIDRV